MWIFKLISFIYRIVRYLQGLNSSHMMNKHLMGQRKFINALLAPFQEIILIMLFDRINIFLVSDGRNLENSCSIVANRHSD